MVIDMRLLREVEDKNGHFGVEDASSQASFEAFREEDPSPRRSRRGGARDDRGHRAERDERAQSILCPPLPAHP